MQIQAMLISHYQDLMNLLNLSSAIVIRESDSYESIKRYLNRNPDLNFIIKDKNEIIACIMCGHDGKRGYIQHLYVKEDYRKQGIAQNLFNKCVNSLKEIEIYKSHIFVLKDNDAANEFWEKNNWKLRLDINMYSYNTSNIKNI
ncbi:MAG: GNAT family N-acetyltransferase [Campylobacterales bacterium]|nr:GNAT family N-acetyltransferase [Campylobacterales bacterium]